MHEVHTVSFDLLWLIPALPLAGVLFHLTLGQRLGKRVVSIVAPGVVFAAFAIAVYSFWTLLGAAQGTVLVNEVFDWITAGSLQVKVTFSLDPLSAVMTLIVTGVGFLIHVYSTGYMHDDEGYVRYFTYLNLFTFAMLLLVLADNVVLLFVGWEGVGLCSYLLIGFWYEHVPNADAGKKAFIVNRVGDAGFLLGIFLLFWSVGPDAHDLSFRSIQEHAGAIPTATVTAICSLLFIGATGKSAQIPLYVWLPDAMAGPTPVSALIHAATMVTAGIYMIARLHFLYSLAPLALAMVAIIGALTAVFAATIGLVQTDIKKVLAYSTVSQLGYMFLALGVGAYGAAIFHLMTHAFFKALLFLGSGSVIHAMHGEQDIRKMGGLWKHMRITAGTFLVGTLAIAGIPGLAGFFSKDEILFNAFAGEHGNPALWVLGVCGTALTAFYMTRLFILTFTGECRADARTIHHLHESPPSMTAPLVILTILSVVGGWVGLPLGLLWGNQFAEFLSPVFGHHAHGHDHALEIVLMIISTLVALSGIALAWVMYVRNPELPQRFAQKWSDIYEMLLNKYWVDESYDRWFVNPTVGAARWLWQVFDVRVVDGAVNETGDLVVQGGRAWRHLQSGNVQQYALSFVLGGLFILAYCIWR